MSVWLTQQVETKTERPLDRASGFYSLFKASWIKLAAQSSLWKRNSALPIRVCLPAWAAIEATTTTLCFNLFSVSLSLFLSSSLFQPFQLNHWSLARLTMPRFASLCCLVDDFYLDSARNSSHRSCNASKNEWSVQIQSLSLRSFLFNFIPSVGSFFLFLSPSQADKLCLRESLSKDWIETTTGCGSQSYKEDWIEERTPYCCWLVNLASDYDVST